MRVLGKEGGEEGEDQNAQAVDGTMDHTCQAGRLENCQKVKAQTRHEVLIALKHDLDAFKLVEAWVMNCEVRWK